MRAISSFRHNHLKVKDRDSSSLPLRASPKANSSNRLPNKSKDSSNPLLRAKDKANHSSLLPNKGRDSSSPLNLPLNSRAKGRARDCLCNLPFLSGRRCGMLS